MSGNTRKLEREEMFAIVKSKSVKILIATYALAKEGLDIPNLDVVIFATPQKNETTVVQSAGRVGRKADGKPFGIVEDICDKFGMLIGWQKRRNTIYRRMGYEITEG